jgi:hypothetical protein
MQKDSAQIKGIVNLVLRDSAGRVKQHKTIRNMVTDYGLAHIVGRMIDPRQDITGDHQIPRMMSHMAVGTGDYANGTATATAAYHRTLENEEGVRVQVKRDTSFNTEYSSFTVQFPHDTNFTRAADGSTVIRVAQTTVNTDPSYLAKFIRAPGGGIGTPIMTVRDTNSTITRVGGVSTGTVTNGTVAFPDDTGIQSIAVETGGILAITLSNPVTVNGTGFADTSNPMVLTFTPIQSQFGRIDPDDGEHLTTVDFSGGGDKDGVALSELGGSGTAAVRGIIGGYYNKTDSGIPGVSAPGSTTPNDAPIPPFFGDADDVPLEENNTDPFVQFGTSVDGVFQGTISGSSVILDSGTTPEGYPTTENDYGSEPAPSTSAPYTAVAGTKKTGTRVVFVATFKEDNPAFWSGGSAEAPIREAGIFNKSAKDPGQTNSFSYSGGASAPTNTSTGGIVTINAQGTTGVGITQTMLCRTTFSVVNKATDDTLQITWSVQLKDTP